MDYVKKYSNYGLNQKMHLWDVVCKKKKKKKKRKEKKDVDSIESQRENVSKVFFKNRFMVNK